MIDAFGQELCEGDKVVAIATMKSTQTLYKGTVVGFSGSCVNVRMDEMSNCDTFWFDICQLEQGEEKRICVSHRLAKI